MSTALAIFQRQDLAITASPHINELTESALATSALIGKVESSAENEQATCALRGIKTLLKGIEDARKATKEPFLNTCREIDGLAKKLAKELEAEALRVSNLQSDFAAEELRKARAIEEARAAEVAKIEADATLEPELKAQAIEAATSVPAPSKPQGQTVREDWEFEVTNIWDVVRTNPGLVEVTLRKRETRECIEAIARTGAEPRIPGLRITKKVKVGVRLGTKTLDV